MAYIYGKNERQVSDAKMLVQDLVVVVKEGNTTLLHHIVIPLFVIFKQHPVNHLMTHPCDEYVTLFLSIFLIFNHSLYHTLLLSIFPILNTPTPIMNPHFYYEPQGISILPRWLM